VSGDDAKAQVSIPDDISPFVSLKFQATAAATSTTSQGSATVEVVISAVAKTSGAAQPGEQVTLDLADVISDQCSATWAFVSTSPGGATEPVLTAIPPDGARFTAPNVSTTTVFTFEATVSCPPDEFVFEPESFCGQASVSVQIADAAFNLPAFIAPGVSLNLNVVARGGDLNPDTDQPILTVTLAPPDFEVLFFVEDGGQPNPNVSLDGLTGDLTVNPTAQNGATVTISVQVLGTAGLLDEQRDTFTVGAP
jgi:hypothetical protein